jgi:Ca2+-binding RTX toxin-like protein
MAIITPSESALRNAIANATPGEVITFNASGTIVLTAGELVINKPLTIDGGTNDIIIDAGGNSRVFNIDDGTNAEVDVFIEGLTITGGNVTGGNLTGNGGGIFNDENLTITDSTIDANTATNDGGGIFNDGTLTVTDSDITNNEVTVGFADGGGIFNNNNAQLTLTNSEVSGNFASDDGGGVYNNDLGSATISGSVIDGNTANNDGGGLFNFGDATVTDTTISNNQVLSDIADGGGVAVFDDITITNSTITGNSAGDDGGGVYIKDRVGSSVPTATITGTTMSGNTAASDGGAIFNFGEAIITDSTITQNEALDKDGTGGGGGIASFGNTDRTSTTVTSSVVAGNVGNSDVVFTTQSQNSFTSGGNNNIGKGNAIGAFNQTGDVTGLMPGVTITQTDSDTDISEDGDTDTYEVTLDSQPTGDVTVTITPDGESTTDVTTLTFNSSDWNIAQTVTVEAVDDDIAEGDHTSTISHTVSGAIEYDGLTVEDVVANITDNDIAGVTIIESDGSTDITEDGATDTYEVVLNSQPTSLVSISLDTDGQQFFTPNIALFDQTNWNIPQSITVFAIDDDIVEGDHSGTISHSISTSDANYNSIAVDDVMVNITDNDSATPPTNPPITGTSGNDMFIGGDGDDIYDGLGGDDMIEGRTGNDQLFGSGGNDTINGQGGDDAVFGGGGLDSLLGGSGNDILNGDGGADTLIGNEGQDELFGGNGADRLIGGFDNDILDGGAGRDTMIGGDGADSFLLRLGDGNDTIQDYDDGTDNFLLENIDFSDIRLTQDGADTIIRYIDPNTMATERLATLTGVDAVDLTSDDFLTL